MDWVHFACRGAVGHLDLLIWSISSKIACNFTLRSLYLRKNPRKLLFAPFITLTKGQGEVGQTEYWDC